MADKEKNNFIWNKGILGVGLPVGLLMAVIAGYQVPGYTFKVQNFNLNNFLSGVLLFVPVFLIAGYFWGIIIYRLKRKK